MIREVEDFRSNLNKHIPALEFDRELITVINGMPVEKDLFSF
jgi:hypothetical protein